MRPLYIWLVAIGAMLLVSASSEVRAQTPEPGRPEKATKFPLERHVVVLPGQIVFVGDTGELDLKGSNAGLYHVLDYLAARPLITLVRIEGHVVVPAEGAQGLSEARALAVAQWLVDHGVDAKRVLPVGFGATKPVVAADAANAPAINTRIEIHNVQLRGRNIGGMPVDGGGHPTTLPTSRPS